MHIILTILFFIMCSKIQSVTSYIDLSNECSNNLKANYFLTYGMGSADRRTLIFAEKQKNCTIHIYTDNSTNLIQIIVIETEVLELNGQCDEHLISDGTKVVNLCKTKFPYVGMFNRSRISVKLKGSYFDGIKLIATAARLTVGECNWEDEFMCNMKGINLCINSELINDFNINCSNCGVSGEDYGTGSYNKHWKVILSGLCLTILILLILIKCCYCLTPKLPKYFFNMQPKTDNKLIMISQKTMPKKLSTKTIIIKPPQKQSIRNTHKHQIVTVVEEEADPLVYERPKPKQKRLTTNSPVHRNSKGGIRFIMNVGDYKSGNTSTTSEEKSRKTKRFNHEKLRS